MGESALGQAATLAPLIGPAWRKARRLYREQRALQQPVARTPDLLDKIFDETLDRLCGGIADEGWWRRICSSMGHAVIAPEHFRVVSVQEWLANPRVRSDLKTLASARLLDGEADDAAVLRRLSDTYMEGTGDAERFAKARINDVLLVLAVAFVDSVERAQEPVAGLVQVAARENRGLHLETQAQVADAVAELGPDYLVVQEHTRRVVAELSLIRKRRGVDPERAAREVRLLLERTDSRGDLRHANPKARNELLHWAARLHAGSRETFAEAKAYRDQLRQSGSHIDTRILDALIRETDGDEEGAVCTLRNADDPDLRSALLLTLRRVRGPKSALEWFDSEPERDDLNFFTGVGWSNLAIVLAEVGRWNEAADRLGSLHEPHIEEWPDVLFIEGVINTALLLPDDYRSFALTMDLFHPALRTIEGAEANRRRERAERCFARAADVMARLDLADRAQAARDWRLWLRLTSPEPTIVHSARDEVAKGMMDGARAVNLMPFARGFGIEFDPEPLRRHLARRSRVGGLEGRELLAELMLAETTMAPRERVEFLTREEARLADAVATGTLVGMRVEALVLDQRSEQARQLLEERKNDLPENDRDRLAAVIDAHAGGDPRSRLEALYRRTGSVTDLHNLVAHLGRVGDWTELRPHLEELFRRERTTDNARRLLDCMRRDTATGEADVLALLEANTDLVDGSSDLTCEKAWALLHVGKLEEAQELTDWLLAERDDKRDLELDINIALQAGDWERFPAIVDREWPRRDAHEPHMLLRLGQLAAEADATADRALELAKLAAEKAPSDPHVLVGAYVLATQVGREADADPHWIARAGQLSSERGPAWTIDMRTVVEEMMPGHRERMQKADRQWTRGEIPIHVAAAALNARLSRLLLDLPQRNSEERDGRRKTIIPIVSGVRQSIDIQQGWVVGIDATSLMVLGYLGLLHKAIKALPKVALAPDTMILLLNERRGARFHQPSLLQAAEELRGLIDRGRLRVPDQFPPPPPRLVDEVGRELAEMLEAARTEGARLVHPFPIYRLRSYLEREAELGEYRDLVISTVAFARILRHAGHIDKDTYDHSDSYLQAHDRADGTHAGSDTLLGHPLYLDGLVLTYLQTAGVLQSACMAGLDLRVHSSLRDQQIALAESNREGEALAQRINRMRLVLREALSENHAVFLRRHDQAHDEQLAQLVETAPTLVQFTRDTGPCDAIALDDRWINKTAGLTDNAGRMVPVVCVLDILRFLRAQNAISEGERLSALHQLRVAGFTMIPVEADELEARLRTTPQGPEQPFVESAELRAIRQNLMRVRSLEAVRLPEEEQYLVSLSLASAIAIRRIWEDESVPIERASACTEWVWRYSAPSPLDWVRSIDHQDITVARAEAFARYSWLWLAPMPRIRPERHDFYTNWVESVVLEPLLAANSEIVDAIAEHVAGEIERVSEEFNAGTDGPSG